ncbi:shugoshin 2 [Petaurus breviceps papuanus]|uniref:shugoshin 2 n=1 Tax=Petaurus breviceps papuanus TaxID=3040969 RepID=UPI0036DB7924
MFASEMEDLGNSANSLFFTQRIKRHVKNKSSRVNKLNTSLASKIRNKIINSSSIKISLKHNNRALAQALSIEKENSRKLTTEKLLLHKEVEKLSFQNAFLRQKLNRLHKTLIETEAYVSSNLISAIEMTSHAEDYQSPSLLPTSQKKDIGKQLDLLHHSFGREILHIRPTHLPMRVLLTSADDDDDDYDDKDGSNLTTKKAPESLTPVASKMSLSNQFHMELSQSPEKHNEDIDTQDNPGRNFSITNVLSTENQTHPEESSSANELTNVQYVGQEKKKRSRSSSQSGNVTERKKRLPSWESSNFLAAVPLAVNLEQIVVSNNALNRSSKINDNSLDTDTKTQQNGSCHLYSQSQSVSELNAEFPTVVLPSDEQQLQKTIYEADMDLTESEISKIITVQTRAKNESNHKSKSSGNKAFRKVKVSSTEKNREKSKVQPKTSSYLHSEERDKDTEESISLTLTDNSKSEDQKFTLETKQLAQLNNLKKVMFQKDNQQDVQFSQHHDKKNKVRKTYVVNDEERVSFFPPTSSESHQDSNCDMGYSSQTVDNSNKDTCFPSQKDNETVSGILENELQAILNCTKGSQSLSDCRTLNSLDIEKQITHVQPSKQSTKNLSKKSSKYSRKKTYELLSKVNQVHENNDKFVDHKESHMEDLNSETNQPEKNTKCQMNNIKNASCIEVISKKMENYDQCSDVQKLDKKYNKNSGKSMSLLIKSKPKTFMQPADLTQCSVPLESGLKPSMRDLESDPESQNECQKGQTQSTTITLNEKTSLSSFMKVSAESELHVKVSNKRRESKSKKSRKTYVVAPIDQNEIREKIPVTVERLIPCDSEQVNQEQNLENEKILDKINPDQFIFNPVMENSSCHLKSLAQMDSSNTRQFSPYTSLKEGLVNSDLLTARDQKLPDNDTSKEPSFQVTDTGQKYAFQENTEGTVFQICRRTETTGKDAKVLQDLTNTSFVSHNSSKPQNALDEVSSILPTRKRKVVIYKEPSLRRKLRR